MHDYFFYFCILFILFNLLIIGSTFSMVYILEKDEKDSISPEMMNEMLKMHGSKEGIIKYSNKVANAAALCIIIAIVSLYIYN